MPLIPGVVETFEHLIKLHKEKNDDYTGDKGPLFNFEFSENLANEFEHSEDKVFATIIGIKIARLSVVLSKTPNFETVEDTFNDIIVYMAIWKANYVMKNKR